MTARRLHRSFLVRAACAALAATASLPGCASEAPPRPQLVVVIDTDAPLEGQTDADPALSPDAVIDTLRVDVQDAQGGAYEQEYFVAPDPGDWPISFGVATPEQSGAGTVTLRLRAFRRGLATTTVVDGVAVLDPRPEIAIDRLVELPLPQDGVRTVLARLSFDCLGTPPYDGKTCVDGARRDAAPGEGVEDLAEDELPATRAGSAPLAREIPCEGPPRDGATCVAGGFLVLGDPTLWGVADGFLEDALPLRPAVVSPFQLDTTEVTVGRFRELLAGGATFAEMPLYRDPATSGQEYCNFLGGADPGNDLLPLNCVSWETASSICEALGGALPTEAQWEHAARGRGQARDYPWGDAEPRCCAASASRSVLQGAERECGDDVMDNGPEPVRSHEDGAACYGLMDASRDAILDLGGSVSELLRDKLRPYGHACWGSGILRDPVCEDAAAAGHAARGGNWSAPLTTTLSAMRRSAVERSATDGLRCAYEVGP